MIGVDLAPEPPSFDRDVRQRGLDAIRELVGEARLRKRPGRRRVKIADSRDAIPADEFPPFWRAALEDMLVAYHRLCAYTCLYIEHVTGAASADHMVPKSTHWDRVYEWNNYRLACALMNSRKKEAMDVLDPFEVKDGWFALEFVDFQVICGPDLDEPTAMRVEATVTRLKLNDGDCLNARREYFRSYANGDVSLGYLERRAPFIARELRRQGKLRTGDV